MEREVCEYCGVHCLDSCPWSVFTKRLIKNLSWKMTPVQEKACACMLHGCDEQSCGCFCHKKQECSKCRRGDPCSENQKITATQEIDNGPEACGVCSYLHPGAGPDAFKKCRCDCHNQDQRMRQATDAECFEAFKTSWEDTPTQDNEGYVPDRGGYKTGWFDALRWVGWEGKK